MLTHDAILAALESQFPRSTSATAPEGVFLVSRLREPALGMADGTPYVFIPDIHLVPQDDAASFPWVTAAEPQVSALERLASVLRGLRALDSTLRVWQLGDYIDLWRTGPEGGSGPADADTTVANRRSLVDAFAAAGVDILVGNHDADLAGYVWPNGRGTLNTVVLDRVGGTGDTVLLHGHQFDTIEGLPRWVKEHFARGFTEALPPAALGMLEATNPHWKPQKVTAGPPKKPNDPIKFLHFGLEAEDPLPLGRDAVNVIAHKIVHDPAKAFIDGMGAHTKPSTDGPGQTFFSDAVWSADQWSINGRDVRLVVIGHTHRARIVRGKRGDNVFVLMDCGACVGSGFLSDELGAPIHNLQIGVKVADDIRIYQLGYVRRT